MKILSHNFLTCLKCGYFPLDIEPTELVNIPQDKNLKFIEKMLGNIDYEVLKQSAKQVGVAGLPDVLPENITENEKAMTALHTILLEVNVVKGCLKCSKCKREYNINNSIPNMILREDEVADRSKNMYKGDDNDDEKTNEQEDQNDEEMKIE